MIGSDKVPSRVRRNRTQFFRIPPTKSSKPLFATERLYTFGSYPSPHVDLQLEKGGSVEFPNLASPLHSGSLGLTNTYDCGSILSPYSYWPRGRSGLHYPYPLSLLLENGGCETRTRKRPVYNSKEGCGNRLKRTERQCATGTT
jgi:hypothetical protein